MELYTLEEGRFLVRLARRAIEEYSSSGNSIGPPLDTPDRLRLNRGAFVTLRGYPDGDLRGCIGRPYPVQPLVKAVIDSAVDAAVNDPRFPPLPASSVGTITVEVSVLTEPREVVYGKPLELRDKVKVGRDGVMVTWTMGSGLLLPQVPVEEGWNVDEYLSYACMKAGAQPDCWLTSKPKISTFQAVVFEEEKPRGGIIRRELEV